MSHAGRGEPGSPGSLNVIEHNKFEEAAIGEIELVIKEVRNKTSFSP